jgi:hypothetical protein
VIIMKTKVLQLGLLSLAIAVSASGVTYTTIMNGENSTNYYFIGGTPSRTTVTSVQSPFAYPSSYLGATDTQTYPSGSGPEPWWFYYYTCGANTCTHDWTGEYIDRPPSHGQISSQKSSVIGFLVKAAFKGTVGTTETPPNITHTGDLDEVAFFTERSDYQGQREIGISRIARAGPYANDVAFAYWFTNDNCGLGGGSGPNMGYPYCRMSQATTGNTEIPSDAWMNGDLVATGYADYAYITGLDTTYTTTYIFQTYIFWASWDSTYKQRVEVFDSTLTTLLFSANIDTTNLGASLGITTSGTSGYVTVGTERADPYNILTSTGIELDVDTVQTITP